MTKHTRARDGKRGPVMAEAIAERVRRYILDGSDEDLRRLLGVAETTREMAHSAFRKVGMQEGWHAIDCGCGPVGGLAVMAEMVGPAGRVVGVDFSEPTIERARSVVAALGWATWSCLLATSTSSTRPPWAARSTWLLPGFS